jgi:hypothetical protein
MSTLFVLRLLPASFVPTENQFLKNSMTTAPNCHYVIINKPVPKKLSQNTQLPSPKPKFCGTACNCDLCPSAPTNPQKPNHKNYIVLSLVTK